MILLFIFSRKYRNHFIDMFVYIAQNFVRESVHVVFRFCFYGITDQHLAHNSMVCRIWAVRGGSFLLRFLFAAFFLQIAELLNIADIAVFAIRLAEYSGSVSVGSRVTFFRSALDSQFWRAECGFFAVLHFF